MPQPGSVHGQVGWGTEQPGPGVLEVSLPHPSPSFHKVSLASGVKGQIPQMTQTSKGRNSDRKGGAFNPGSLWLGCSFKAFSQGTQYGEGAFNHTANTVL